MEGGNNDVGTLAPLLPPMPPPSSAAAAANGLPEVRGSLDFEIEDDSEFSSEADSDEETSDSESESNDDADPPSAQNIFEQVRHYMMSHWNNETPSFLADPAHVAGVVLHVIRYPGNVEEFMNLNIEVGLPPVAHVSCGVLPRWKTTDEGFDSSAPLHLQLAGVEPGTEAEVLAALKKNDETEDDDYRWHSTDPEVLAKRDIDSKLAFIAVKMLHCSLTLEAASRAIEVLFWAFHQRSHGSFSHVYRLLRWFTVQYSSVMVNFMERNSGVMGVLMPYLHHSQVLDLTIMIATIVKQTMTMKHATSPISNDSFNSEDFLGAVLQVCVGANSTEKSCNNVVALLGDICRVQCLEEQARSFWEAMVIPRSKSHLRKGTYFMGGATCGLNSGDENQDEGSHHNLSFLQILCEHAMCPGDKGVAHQIEIWRILEKILGFIFTPTIETFSDTSIQVHCSRAIEFSGDVVRQLAPVLPRLAAWMDIGLPDGCGESGTHVPPPSAVAPSNHDVLCPPAAFVDPSLPMVMDPEDIPTEVNSPSSSPLSLPSTPSKATMPSLSLTPLAATPTKSKDGKEYFALPFAPVIDNDEEEEERAHSCALNLPHSSVATRGALSSRPRDVYGTWKSQARSTTASRSELHNSCGMRLGSARVLAVTVMGWLVHAEPLTCGAHLTAGSLKVLSKMMFVFPNASLLHLQCAKIAVSLIHLLAGPFVGPDQAGLGVDDLDVPADHGVRSAFIQLEQNNEPLLDRGKLPSLDGSSALHNSLTADDIPEWRNVYRTVYEWLLGESPVLSYELESAGGVAADAAAAGVLKGALFLEPSCAPGNGFLKDMGACYERVAPHPNDPMPMRSHLPEDSFFLPVAPPAPLSMPNPPADFPDDNGEDGEEHYSSNNDLVVEDWENERLTLLGGGTGGCRSDDDDGGLTNVLSPLSLGSEGDVPQVSESGVIRAGDDDSADIVHFSTPEPEDFEEGFGLTTDYLTHEVVLEPVMADDTPGDILSSSTHHSGHEEDSGPNTPITPPAPSLFFDDMSDGDFSPEEDGGRDLDGSMGSLSSYSGSDADDDDLLAIVQQANHNLNSRKHFKGFELDIEEVDPAAYMLGDDGSEEEEEDAFSNDSDSGGDSGMDEDDEDHDLSSSGILPGVISMGMNGGPGSMYSVTCVAERHLAEAGVDHNVCVIDDSLGGEVTINRIPLKGSGGRTVIVVSVPLASPVGQLPAPGALSPTLDATVAPGDLSFGAPSEVPTIEDVADVEEAAEMVLLGATAKAALGYVSPEADGGLVRSQEIAPHHNDGLTRGPKKVNASALGGFGGILLNSVRLLSSTIQEVQERCDAARADEDEAEFEWMEDDVESGEDELNWGDGKLHNCSSLAGDTEREFLNAAEPSLVLAVARVAPELMSESKDGGELSRNTELLLRTPLATAPDTNHYTPFVTPFSRWQLGRHSLHKDFGGLGTNLGSPFSGLLGFRADPPVANLPPARPAFLDLGLGMPMPLSSESHHLEDDDHSDDPSDEEGDNSFHFQTAQSVLQDLENAADAAGEEAAEESFSEYEEDEEDGFASISVALSPPSPSPHSSPVKGVFSSGTANRSDDSDSSSDEEERSPLGSSGGFLSYTA